MAAISKEEYTQLCETRMAMPAEEFWQRWLAMPCRCADPICNGWRLVANDPQDIAIYNEEQGEFDAD
jgi:hypothetical protein